MIIAIGRGPPAPQVGADLEFTISTGGTRKTRISLPFRTHAYARALCEEAFVPPRL